MRERETPTRYEENVISQVAGLGSAFESLRSFQDLRIDQMLERP
jgi:hypothetical protein